MTISEIIKELSKLDLRTPLLFSNNSRIWFGDLLYIKVKEGKVKSYTVLKMRTFIYLNGKIEYTLADEYDNICTVGRERIYLYIGQDLKIQRVYDIISQTIILLLMAAFLFLTVLFLCVWENFQV